MKKSRNLSEVLEAANQVKNSAMEAENHVKRGASSKCLISRGNRKLFILFILLVGAFVFSTCEKNKENNPNQFIGVWKNITPDAIEMIKIITKERWIWTYTHENKIVYSLGGSYTFDGETYTESIEYGTPNMNSYYLGDKSIFKAKFEGNKMYIVGGNQKETYDQVWERVE